MQFFFHWPDLNNGTIDHNHSTVNNGIYIRIYCNDLLLLLYFVSDIICIGFARRKKKDEILRETEKPKKWVKKVANVKCEA